ncbi:hypothetical protein TRVA0_001S03334 [Trichomonascus vanleenenianus]|uniref:G-protein coupled receptor n=1 Tax=Trichomonascus vanleenenianus TaxID=2268995 RepID=UPI003EC97AF6
MSDLYEIYHDPYTEAVTDYSDSEVMVLRLLAISASCVSIAAGLVAFYLYTNMKEKLFRHRLILLLLISDFLKGLILLWYPARILVVDSAALNRNFCSIVGFLTSVFIECADINVAVLAIHTALLVFRKDGTTSEAGLYPYKKYIYAFNVVLPLILASLAFIHNGRDSYLPYVTWCYLPIRPVWFRIVLSWALRYAIMIAIIVIYVSIYIYVKRQYDQVVQNFSLAQTHIDEREFQKGIRGRWWRFKRWLKSALSHLPGFAFLDEQAYHYRRYRQSPEDPNSLDEEELRRVSQTNAIIEFQRNSMIQFQMRRSLIERQVRSIFIYPAAYVFLWVFPLILQGLQFKTDLEKSKVLWIAAIAAFMQPFNCTVDTIAFMLRETPWRNSEERIFTRRNWQRIKHVATLQFLRRSSKRKHCEQKPATASSDSLDTYDDKHHTHTHVHSESSTRNNSCGTSSSDHRKPSTAGSLQPAPLFASPYAMNLTTDPSQLAEFTNSADSPPGPVSPLTRSGSTMHIHNDNPFLATTASRVVVNDHHNDANDENDREMDLLEFLR